MYYVACMYGIASLRRQFINNFDVNFEERKNFSNLLENS